MNSEWEKLRGEKWCPTRRLARVFRERMLFNVQPLANTIVEKLAFKIQYNKYSVPNQVHLACFYRKMELVLYYKPVQVVRRVVKGKLYLYSCI